MTRADDDGLVEKAQGGDRRALEELLQAYEAPLFRFAMKLCRHPEDARGVLQEAMMDAVRGLATYRGEASFSTWLYTLARNRCLKRRRRGKHAPDRLEPLHEQAHLEDMAVNPADAALQRELRDTVEAAIAALDEESREVLVLRDVEGLSGHEAAEVLGISLAATKSRLHRARKALREALAPHVAPADAGCPDVLTAFSENLEGELRPRDCEAMQRHLASCERCRVACDGLGAALEACHRLPTPVVPDDVRDAVRAAIRRTFSSSG